MARVSPAGPSHHRCAAIAVALAEHTGPGRPSVRWLQRILTPSGGRPPSLSTVHADLVTLRSWGLVEWEQGRDGSLRAAVGIAAVSVDQLAPNDERRL